VSVEFDPIKLRPGRRRVDPVVVGVLVVVIALGLAVAKPWVPSQRAEAPDPSAAVAIAPRATALGRTPSPAATQPSATPRPSPSPSWTDIAPVLDIHREWGVEAVLLLPTTTASQARPSRFVSYWSPAAPGPDGPQSAYISRDDQSIVALGVTYPADQVPVDARIWLVHAGDELEWMDVRMVVGGAPDGAMLFERTGAPVGQPSSWPGGHYRVDVLVAGKVRRIAVQIPGRLGSVAQPDPWPATSARLVVPDDSDPSGVHVGLFATVNGRGIPLAATPWPLLDEATAWLSAADPAGRTSGPTVARAYLPLATGLGVMLTSQARVGSANISRLAPDARFDAGPVLGGLSRIEGRTPYLVFAPRDGGAFTPGVYAVSIEWTDALGSHAGTWHVELRPGPVAPGFGIDG
jgi:hypothetical protein